MSKVSQLDLFTGGMIADLIEIEVQRFMKKKACPVCRDTMKDQFTGKDCFYCKKPVDKAEPK